MTYCALCDGQKNSDGTTTDTWIIKQASCNEKTGAFTEHVIKLIYDDIMSRYELDPQTRFSYNTFSHNVSWYADCSDGILSRWNHNITFKADNPYSGYTQISHEELIFSVENYTSMFHKYNERVRNGIRTYANHDLNKIKMPAFITDHPYVYLSNEFLKNPNVKSLIVNWQFEQAITEWTYDKLVGLMLIEHYSKSTEDELFINYLDWIQLGDVENYRFKLEESAINIFKKGKTDEVNKEVGETFFYCYKPLVQE